MLIAAFSIIGVCFSIKQQAKIISSDPFNAGVFVTTNVTIAETGILLKDIFTERFFQWPAFIKKKENKEYYFLFYSFLEAIIVPKKFLKAPN